MQAMMAAFKAPAASPHGLGSSAEKSPLWEGSEWGPPEINSEELEYLEKIGGGCFGSVYRGRCRGKEVAIKKLFKQDVDEKTLADFRKEVQIMSQLRHPNTLLFMGACTTPGKMALVTEMMPKGNLATFLHEERHANFPLHRRLIMARDCALGMNWLHCSQPVIVHRDLKPSNLLLDEHLRVKVCDFGLSAVKQRGDKLQDKGGIPGTPLWMAPEVLMGKPLDEKADVYSFGIVLWEIFMQKEPFEQFENYKEFKRAVCKDNERPEIPKSCPASLAALMAQCWDKDPSVRPSFTQIISILEQITVDVCISDEAGNRFWKSHFLGKDKVGWAEFVGTIAKALGLSYTKDDLRFRSFQALLAEKALDGMADELVKPDSFGKLLAWFGPMEVAMLDRMRELLQQPWFHGSIETDEAVAVLTGEGPGAYIVRLSSSTPGCFTITKVSKKGTITHQRINFSPQKGYTLQIQGADGHVNEVVGHGSLVQFLAANKNELFLHKAVACTKYRLLFEKSNVEGYLMPADDD